MKSCIHTYLLSKRSSWGNLESLEKLLISSFAGLVDKHSSIEVQRRRGAHLRRPSHLIGALLAIPNGVLR